MIELTQGQIVDIHKTGSTPLRIVNPQTQEMFVLLPLAEYQRLSEGADTDDSPWTDEERDLLRWEACQTLDSFGKETP